MSSLLIYKHYLVSGRVQGVGYRRFALAQAKALGLNGGARNLRDGRVEIVAVGSHESLEIFERALSRGPMWSSVSQIEKQDLNGEQLKRRPKEFGPEFETSFTENFAVYKDGEMPWI